MLDFFNALARNERLPSYGKETERSCQDAERKSESEERQFTSGSHTVKKVVRVTFYLKLFGL